MTSSRWVASAAALLALGPAAARAQQVVVGEAEYGGAGGAWADEESGAARQAPPSPRQIPASHRVQPGETLWSISERYFGDAEQWPRLWALNPEITNPHWIYPDDVVRLRAEGQQESVQAQAQPAPRAPARPPSGSVYLEEMGWLDADAVREGGKVVGSPRDKALLATYDEVYVGFDDASRLEPGLELTVYERVPRSERMEDESGELVRVVGTIRVERVDRERRVARGVITVAYDPIERGMAVARIDRRFEWVEPVPADRDLESRVVAVLRPRHMVGSYQLVFVPVGERQGVRRGFRFQIVRRGDEWRRTYREAGIAPGVMADPDRPLPEPDEEAFPDEVLAEGVVVGVRPGSAALLVRGARREVEVGDRALLRRGH